jgi:phenylalanyl-tRNA synthetase beta chain
MKASLSWLKDYVPINLSVDRLTEALTMVGLEVEAVSERWEYLSAVIVGQIREIQPHPKAEKLQLCNVNLGTRNIRVVCGAPNVAPDLLVPVALPGAIFPDGSVLKETVIRGIASQGMICSESELGLGTDSSGVMILAPSVTVGDNLANSLNLSDIIVEIDLTPNRPDCLSIIGIAREIGGIQKTRLSYPPCELSDSGDEISRMTSVTIEAPDLCPRYAARLVTDISIGPSPFWLQDRLMSVGLRPINNIVDITNFVLMETGQPLHAFDFDRLAGQRIVVRPAAEGEGFTTLDEKERRLTRDTLMICDAKRPVAIGGVMGGLNSEIEKTTRNVLIESAYFNPASIRKTAKNLGLYTEASHRFERGVDPEGTISALNRAAQLMVEIGNGNLVAGIIDEYPQPVASKEVRLRVKDTNRLLGTGFNSNEIRALLESIEFKVKSRSPEILTIIPPSFRVDITRPEDLMEEVARLSGYNYIPTTFPAVPAEERKFLKSLEIRNRIKHTMTGFGFSEVINYSFVNRNVCDRLALAVDDPRRKMITLLNPLTEEQTVMRTSLLPGLLDTMHYNIAQQEKNLKLFEIGKIFISAGQDKLPEEIEMLTGLWTGSRYDASWHYKEMPCDFFDIKGVVEGLLERLNLEGCDFTTLPDAACTYTKPGYTAQIHMDDSLFGLIGEVHPQVLENFDLLQTVFIFELHVDRLIRHLREVNQFKPIAKFPAITRDITIIVDKDIEAQKIIKHIENADEELIEDLHLFDVYEGAPIAAGKKSISLRIIYRSPDKTLEDQEIRHLTKNITDRLVKAFNASLPV